VVPIARRRAVRHQGLCHVRESAWWDVSAPRIAQSGIRGTASLATNAQVRIDSNGCTLGGLYGRSFSLDPSFALTIVHRPTLKRRQTSLVRYRYLYEMCMAWIYLTTCFCKSSMFCIFVEQLSVHFVPCCRIF